VAQDERNPVPPAALQALDAAASVRGEAVAAAYASGREQTRKQAINFDRMIQEAKDEASKQKAIVDRRQLGNYAAFPFDVAIQETLDGLER
jgi:hypothetical protein